MPSAHDTSHQQCNMAWSDLLVFVKTVQWCKLSYFGVASERVNFNIPLSTLSLFKWWVTVSSTDVCLHCVVRVFTTVVQSLYDGSSISNQYLVLVASYRILHRCLFVLWPPVIWNCFEIEAVFARWSLMPSMTWIGLSRNRIQIVRMDHYISTKSSLIMMW